MRKVALQFILLVGLFFGTWFALQQIDWMTLLRVQKVTQSTEEKLGKLFWDIFSKDGDHPHSKIIDTTLDSLITHICASNLIDRSRIKLHILNNDEINAFTLPDHHLVVFTGLIRDAESEGELMGVLGHEIAHMEKNHVMKKLIKEVGLSVLISITNSGAGGEIIRQTAKTLSSTAYDRELEKEADLTAVDYLVNADVDPEQFANFLYRLSDKQVNIPNQVYWISTHPDSKDRAEAIIDFLKGKKYSKKPVLPQEQWEEMKKAVNNEQQ